jgi:hypothetical protein
MNSSQEFLNLAKAGDTAGGVQSSGNGSTGGTRSVCTTRSQIAYWAGLIR